MPTITFSAVDAHLPGASLDGDCVETMEMDFRDISLSWKVLYELRVIHMESEAVYTSISA